MERLVRVRLFLLFTDSFISCCLFSVLSSKTLFMATARQISAPLPVFYTFFGCTDVVMPGSVERSKPYIRGIKY